MTKKSPPVTVAECTWLTKHPYKRQKKSNVPAPAPQAAALTAAPAPIPLVAVDKAVACAPVEKQSPPSSFISFSSSLRTAASSLSSDLAVFTTSFSSSLCIAASCLSTDVLHTGQNWHYVIEIFDVEMMEIQSGGCRQCDTCLANCDTLMVRIPPLACNCGRVNYLFFDQDGML